MSKKKPSQKNKAAPEKQESLPNVWARAGDRNPYLHNVFALLGVDPDSGERAFERRVSRVDRRIEAGKEITVQGKAIEKTDVARARDLMANAVQFVAERLLFHTVHKVDGEAFEKHTQAIESLRFPTPGELLPLPVRDLTLLTRLLPDLDEVAGGEPVPLPAERFCEVAAPGAEPEQIFDV